LDQLDKSDRMLIIIIFFEGLKFSEIGQVTDSNINIVIPQELDAIVNSTI